MARSQYIYLLRNKETKENLGAWTVKGEALGTIEWEDLDIDSLELVRFHNGLGPEYIYDLQDEIVKNS